MIERVLADLHEEAAILDRVGETKQAAARREIAERVTAALGDYLTWLGEAEAALWTGRSERTLRASFDLYREMGHARQVGRHRQYRAAILPRRTDYLELRRRAREDAAA
jgi:hypothetical protein